MNIYLDDDSVDRQLIARLQSVGHTVTIPADVGLVGAPDAQHLTNATRAGLVIITRNHDDFVDLHELLVAGGGSHAGIFIVRFDNDPSRDMKLGHIVRAIEKLQSASVPIAGEVYILNQWR